MSSGGSGQLKYESPIENGGIHEKLVSHSAGKPAESQHFVTFFGRLGR
jgi:hypothetical protein